jgi:hypothetical protein
MRPVHGLRALHVDPSRECGYEIEKEAIVVTRTAPALPSALQILEAGTVSPGYPGAT